MERVRELNLVCSLGSFHAAISPSRSLIRTHNMVWRSSPDCQHRIIDAQARLKPAIKLSRKDWHSSCKQSGTVVSSGRLTCSGILPRRLHRRGGASVVRRNAAVNRTEDLNVKVSRSNHLRHRQRLPLLQNPRNRPLAISRLRNPILAQSNLASSRCCNHQAGPRLPR